MIAKQELGPLQQRWIKALRSGRYKQGRMYLRTGNEEHCCLGVACRVLRIPSERLTEHGHYSFGEQAATLTAPKEVVEKLQLYSHEGELVQRALKGHSKLTAANDIGRSFEVIADWIEANADCVFREPR